MPRDCCTTHIIEDCATFLLRLKQGKRVSKAQQRESDALATSLMLHLGAIAQMHDEMADA